MSTPSLAEFEALNPVKLRQCKVGTARDALSEGEREKLDAALKASTFRISNAAIIKWIEQRGLEAPSVNAVTAHRRSSCRCFKAGS